jgi:hypothetical protein
MTDETSATVASKQTEGTVLRMTDVDLLITDTVKQDGRISTGPEFYSQKVEYAVKVDGEVEQPETDETVDVVRFVNVDDYGKKEVLKNGVLVLGKEYEGKDVTVAIKKISDPTENTKEALTV